MSDSNRSLRLAAIGAATAALFIALGTGAYFGSLYAPHKNYYQTEATSGSRADPHSSPKNGLADASGVPSHIERAIANPKPDSREERENRDLAAQEGMAALAFWMFAAVMLQTLLAGGALIALLKDLSQNRASAEQQLRAYITLESFIWNAKAKDFKFQIKWVNRGQTPAYKVDAWANWRDYEAEITDDFGFERPQIQNEGLIPVGPGQSVLGVCDEKPTIEMIKQAAKGDRNIYVWGAVTYFDAFGDRRYGKVAANAAVEILSDGSAVIRWVSIPLHNEST